MEVLSDFNSHRQYLSDAIESNYEFEGSYGLNWDPPFSQVSEPCGTSMHMLDALSCNRSSNGSLLEEMVSKLDVMHDGKPTPTSKVRSLACQSHIKKSSGGRWSASTNNALRRGLGCLLEQGLVYVNGVPVFLDKPPESSVNQMCLGTNASAVAHKHNSGDPMPMQSSRGLELPHIYWESASEKRHATHSYARSPVDSACVSLISSESSTCNEVLGSSEIQLMDILFDQSILMGDGNEAWFEDPSSSIEGIHSYTDDGGFINNDPKMEESAVDVKGEPSTFVYDGMKAARSQGFLGGNSYHSGNDPLTELLNENDELPICPRIDFEDSFVQSHSLAQAGKILIPGSLPAMSGCPQEFCLPRPISGSSSYSYTQNLHVTDGFSASPTILTCGSRIKCLERYDSDGRQVNAGQGSLSSKSSGGYGSKGSLAPQVLKLAKSEDSMDAFLSGKMADLRESRALECKQYETRSKNDQMENASMYLLTAAAEALARGDTQAASVMLVRLRDRKVCSDNTIHRVISYFIGSLERQIESRKGVEKGNNSSKSEGDILAAFQILHEILPYIKFGHFTANQAILEAVQGAKRVHIVDFDILEGIQWSAFMQALVLREGGPPDLRITALYRPSHGQQASVVQRTCERLSEFAATIGLGFAYKLVAVSDDEARYARQIEVAHAEALVVNCMVHLPHMPQHCVETVTSFLRTMRKFSPCIVTLVKEELGCSTTTATSFFSEALNHFHAICDSLEACLPSAVKPRMLVERVFMAPRIDSAIGMWSRAMSPCSTVHGADVTDRHKWSTFMQCAGFKPLPLSFRNEAQARLLLGLHRDGFKLEERSHHLILGWQSKPLYAASMWN